MTGKESARSCKGLTQKLIRFRPSDLKRFESRSLAISVRVLNLNAESTCEGSVSRCSTMFPTVREFHCVVSVWYYEGILVFLFFGSLLLGKSFFSKIKFRNALPFVPEFSSKIRERHWLSSVEYRISWKAFICARLICAFHRIWI